MVIDANTEKPAASKGDASASPVRKRLTRAESLRAHQAFSAACAYWSVLQSDPNSTFEETYAANEIALDAKAVIVGTRQKSEQTPFSFKHRFSASPKCQFRKKAIAEGYADDFAPDAAIGSPAPQTGIAFGRNYANPLPRPTQPQITKSRPAAGDTEFATVAPAMSTGASL